MSGMNKHFEIPVTDPQLPPNWMNTKCWTVAADMTGKVISISDRRRCPVEDCTGRQLGIRWEDGKLTWVCEESMTSYRNGLRVGDSRLWKQEQQRRKRQRMSSTRA